MVTPQRGQIGGRSSALGNLTRSPANAEESH